MIAFCFAKLCAQSAGEFFLLSPRPLEDGVPCCFLAVEVQAEVWRW